MRSRLDPEIVTAGLVTPGQPWVDVEFHPAIGSTNDRARELAAAEPDRPWRVVLTDHQTGGRGRLGRTWEVPDRASLAVSALVPITDPSTAGWFPLLAGVALVRAITDVTAEGAALHPVLKWPNDVLLPEDGERKVSGILCELVPLGARQGVVVGTGVNVHQTRAELPVDTATSLDLCSAALTRREGLVVSYLRHLADLLRPLVEGDEASRAEALERGRAAYEMSCSTVGSDVRVHLPAREATQGRASAIDPHGALVVQTPLGPRTFAAGDVIHVRRQGTGLA